MIFQKDYLPQFREADPDGLVGLRGYMNYFQDVATHFMHNLHKGNDELPERYGIVWMYTKYKMQVLKRADFTKKLRLETWIPPGRLAAVMRQNLLISREGEVYAKGCLESCLYHMSQNRLARLKEIAFPADIAELGACPMPEFEKLPAKPEPEPGDYCYTHQIRYTDLDKTGHITNLKYIDLFLNAFENRFFEQFAIQEFELHFLEQCFEGEELQVYRTDTDDGIRLTAFHGGHTPCAVASVLVVKKEESSDDRE